MNKTKEFKIIVLNPNEDFKMVFELQTLKKQLMNCSFDLSNSST